MAPISRVSARRHASPVFGAYCRQRPLPRAGGGGSACDAPSGFLIFSARDLDCNQWSERMELLRKSEVFGVLASDDLSFLAPLMESRTLADGDLLFEQGEQARDAYLVASGQLRVFDSHGDTTIAHLGAGKVIGEYGMFVEHRRTFSARAEGPVQLWAISYPVLYRFLLAYPELMFSLMRQTVTRLLDLIGRSTMPEAISRSAAVSPPLSLQNAPTPSTRLRQSHQSRTECHL